MTVYINSSDRFLYNPPQLRVAPNQLAARQCVQCGVKLIQYRISFCFFSISFGAHVFFHLSSSNGCFEGCFTLMKNISTRKIDVLFYEVSLLPDTSILTESDTFFNSYLCLHSLSRRWKFLLGAVFLVDPLSCKSLELLNVSRYIVYCPI